METCYLSSHSDPNKKQHTAQGDNVFSLIEAQILIPQ